jgi:peptide/nickel transport system substrate-binding protein
MIRARIAILLALLLLLLTACAAPPATSDSAESDTSESDTSESVESESAEAESTSPASGRDTFVYVRPLEIVSLDPATITESQSGFIVRNVYSRLVDIAYDGAGVEPDLAESWEVSDDGLVYTFNLRDGVTFHDGSPLVASDVAYSIDRMLTLGEGDASILSNVLDVGSTVAVDDATVQMTINEPFLAFLEVLGLPRGASVVSQAWVEENATDEDPWATEFLATNAMGSGPFTFGEWIPNEYARLERYDDYHGGPAALGTVISLMSQDDTTTRLSLEKGEVDIVQRLPNDMIEAMADNPDVTVYNKPTSSSTFWVMNTLVPPYDDIRVREAFNLAVDYDGLMEGLVGEGGTRMNTPVYQEMPYHDGEVPLIERDVEKAKALLAEAGYEDGLEIDLVYVDFGLIKQVAVVLQAYLAEANIQANLVEMPFGPFLEGVGADEIGFYSWVSEPNYPHPMAIVERFTSDAVGTGLGGNISNYTDPAYDALIEQIRTTTDEEELAALYSQAQTMLMDNQLWMLLFQENLHQVTGSWVDGFDFGAYNYLNLHDVSVE